MLVCKAQNNRLKAEIRKDKEGFYSVFTWQDLGAPGGVVNWLEKHNIKEWAIAHKMAADWVNDQGAQA